MAEGKNDFKTTLESLFRGMDGVVSSKTVVGDAIHINGTIILPLVDVSFGIGAGAFSAEKKEKGMGGIGGKMSPSAVIVIQDGKTRLVNIKNQDTITKILFIVYFSRFTIKTNWLNSNPPRIYNLSRHAQHPPPRYREQKGAGELPAPEMCVCICVWMCVHSFAITTRYFACFQNEPGSEITSVNSPSSPATSS